MDTNELLLMLFTARVYESARANAAKKHATNAPTAEQVNAEIEDVVKAFRKHAETVGALLKG